MIRSVSGEYKYGLSNGCDLKLGYGCGNRTYRDIPFTLSVDSDGYLHSYNFEPVEEEFDTFKTYYIHGVQVTKEYMETLKNRLEILDEL